MFCASQKMSPQSTFLIMKGVLNTNGPILQWTYGDEEISISMMRLANIILGDGDNDDNNDINKLFLYIT